MRTIEWVTKEHVPAYLAHFPLSLSRQRIQLTWDPAMSADVDVHVGDAVFARAFEHRTGTVRLCIGEHGFYSTDILGAHVTGLSSNTDDGLFLVVGKTYKELPAGFTEAREAFEFWVRQCEVDGTRLITPRGVIVKLQ